MKKILILSYHVYPSRSIGAKRVSEFANYLVDEGHEVDIIGAKPLSPKDIDINLNKNFKPCSYYISENRKFLDILWAKAKILRRRLKSKKIAHSFEIHNKDEAVESEESTYKRYIFSLQALFDANKLWLLKGLFLLTKLKRKKEYDLILASSPPDSIYLLALFAKKIFGCPLAMDLRDPLFNYNDAANNTKSQIRFKLEKYFAHLYLKKTNIIFCSTDNIGKDLTERFNYSSSVTVVYNGFDTCGNDEKLVGPIKNNIFNVLYTGSLYLHRNPFPLFTAIKNLIDKSCINANDVKFELYGNVESWGGVDLNKWILDNDLDRVILLKNTVNHSEVIEIQSKANLLINFSQNQPLQIPAKSFEYIASLKPVLTFCEVGSASQLLLNTVPNQFIVSSDINEIETIFMSLYNSWKSGELIETPIEDVSRFNRKNQFLKMSEVIDTVLATNRN